jgi:hypothetical protein
LQAKYQRLAAALVALCCAACGPEATPVAPTPPDSATRIISVAGELDFGAVVVGSQSDRSVTVANDGNANLSVSGITFPCAGSIAIVGSQAFAIPSGSALNVTFRFSPLTVDVCNGAAVFASDATSGSGSAQLTAVGTLEGVPLLAMIGTGGGRTINIPPHVFRVRVAAEKEASFTSAACIPFKVIHAAVAGALIDVKIGRCAESSGERSYSTEIAVPLGDLIMLFAERINWSVTEVR